MGLVPWKGKRREDDGDIQWAGPALGSFRSEMDRLFDRFFSGFRGEPAFPVQAGFAPSVDIGETDTEITVRAEVPGIDAKDLNITLSGQVLTLSGEKKESTERKGENFYHAERRFGSFRRNIQLPTAVNPEKINAEHKNGVVFIRLQKDQRETPRRIPVQIARE